MAAQQVYAREYWQIAVESINGGTDLNTKYNFQT